MLFSRSENTQSRSVGGIPAGFGIEFFSKPAHILGFVIDDWEHPAKKEQVASLQRLHIGAERRGGGWELNAKVLQPAICSTGLRTLHGYHRPTCAPSSTCSTSPATCVASIK